MKKQLWKSGIISTSVQKLTCLKDYRRQEINFEQKGWIIFNLKSSYWRKINKGYFCSHWRSIHMCVFKLLCNWMTMRFSLLWYRLSITSGRVLTGFAVLVFVHW